MRRSSVEIARKAMRDDDAQPVLYEVEGLARAPAVRHEGELRAAHLCESLAGPKSFALAARGRMRMRRRMAASPFEALRCGADNAA